MLIRPEYWQEVLASESLFLSSLRYFDPTKASLQNAHPMWTSSIGNSFECSKSTILARMISGRYRTEMMCRFWSTNRDGYCLSATCHQVEGDLEHLLIVCPALEHVRNRLHSLWLLKTVNFLPLHHLILRVLGSEPTVQAKFILDSTANPEVITLIQDFGQEVQNMVMYLTRTWAFSMHRHKMIMLGRWPESSTRTVQNTQTCQTPKTYLATDNNYSLTNIDTNHLTKNFHFAGNGTRQFRDTTSDARQFRATTCMTVPPIPPPHVHTDQLPVLPSVPNYQQNAVDSVVGANMTGQGGRGGRIMHWGTSRNIAEHQQPNNCFQSFLLFLQLSG